MGIVDYSDIREYASMTPIEAAAAAAELAARMERLAALDSHPTTNAAAIRIEWAECSSLLVDLRAHVEFLDVPA